MKSLALFLLLSFYSVAFAGGTIGGGGSGSSKALLELSTIPFSIEKLPIIEVDSDILRRAEARLSTLGMEAVDMPLGGSSVSVRKLGSSVVDTDFTRRFVAE